MDSDRTTRSVRRFAHALVCCAALLSATCKPKPEGNSDLSGSSLGTRVLVVERSSESLAVYDYAERKVLPVKLEKLGDLHHATMVFSPDLRWGFLATRNGKVSRINLTSLKVDGSIQTSDNSIDNAISHDGKTVAVAEYIPGGVSLVDVATLSVRAKIPGTVMRDGKEIRSKVTGMVDAPGNKFVCVLMEGGEVWILDATKGQDAVEMRIPIGEGLAYDAMITADGRYYVVGKLGAPRISVIDLSNPSLGAREVSLGESLGEATGPKKLPHMASWAVAGEYVFVPTVGEKRMSVLARKTWKHVQNVPLRGHPVYAVRSPTEREVWVSFSGEENDSFIQVIDVETLSVIREIEVGKRVYHLDFTPRGSHVIATANGADELVLLDARTYKEVDRQKLKSPSGVFGIWRAFRIGL